MKIGIIGAMEVEVAKMKELLEGSSSEEISGQIYFCGKICKTDVVISKCGEGKVNAAVCAQTMILKYKPDIIINTGVAGGISKVKVKDLVIAENVVQHDMDMSFLGYDFGYVMGINGVKIKCDDDVKSRLVAASKTLLDTNVYVGTVASGDQFIHTDKQRAFILENFDALCAEMEGASIGHVCTLNNTPFCVVRAISDSADGESNISFNTFMEIAAEISSKLVYQFILDYHN